MESKKQNNNRKNIPASAKRVFKGVIFDVWQWKQKMFDGSFEIFEKLQRPNTVNVIPIVGDKIMILRQRQPDWKKEKTSIAGGRIDEGEKPLAAAKRELLEETGYESKNWELWKEQNPSGKIIWTVYTYIARDCKFKQPPQLDTGEKIKTKIISFDDFLMLSEEPNFYEGEIKSSLLRARLNKRYRKELYNLFFKK
jgi:ADP-ribose pyrophosphatase